MKRDKISLKPKVLDREKHHYSNTVNFCYRCGQSLPNFYPFFMAWMKVSKIQPIFDKFSKPFQQYLPQIFQTFTEFNEKWRYFIQVIGYFTKLMKFHKISWYNTLLSLSFDILHWLLLSVLVLLTVGQKIWSHLDCLKISKFQNFKISKFQNFKISKFQNFKISKFQNFWFKKSISQLPNREVCQGQTLQLFPNIREIQT